jgi:protein-L-isoaspartate(D-aspartate) O-methyltransferase
MKKHKGKMWDNEINKRLLMVENQLKSRGIADQNVLSAMSKIPRHLFIPPEKSDCAYDDGPLSIGEGQTISQPYIVALMTQCLQIGENEKILEIGTGSGYQMSILLELTRNVYSMERLPSLAQKARKNLTALGHKDLQIRVGDGTCGWSEEAPFDGIIVTSGAPDVPPALKQQLAEGGRLVIPAGSRYTQTLYTITRKGNTFHQEEITPCVFVPLIGKHGWEEDRVD